MIAVCVKWVAARAEPDDDRFAGISDADQAALELALRHAERAGADGTEHEVVVVSFGPPAAERALRDAVACGATRAIRIHLTDHLPADVTSDVIAAALSGAVAGAAFVWCGDLSIDRGSGSVPAFLAAHLGAAQALGAVAVQLPGELYDEVDHAASGAATGGPTGASDAVIVTRRLDGGRREVVAARAPAVISVEGAAARLRRAGLGASLAARQAPVEQRTAPAAAATTIAATAHPYRPRARELAAPAGSTLERLRALTDSAGAPARGETVHLEPDAAAARILAVLAEWGY